MVALFCFESCAAMTSWRFSETMAGFWSYQKTPFKFANILSIDIENTQTWIRHRTISWHSYWYTQFHTVITRFITSWRTFGIEYARNTLPRTVIGSLCYVWKVMTQLHIFSWLLRKYTDLLPLLHNCSILFSDHKEIYFWWSSLKHISLCSWETHFPS